jgi:hypothetical protein
MPKVKRGADCNGIATPSAASVAAAGSAFEFTGELASQALTCELCVNSAKKLVPIQPHTMLWCLIDETRTLLRCSSGSSSSCESYCA